MLNVPDPSRCRVLFVQEAALSGGGSSANSARKVQILRDNTARVRVAALCVERSGLPGRLLLLEKYLRAVWTLRTADVLYARLVPRALPLAFAAALLRRAVILEANGQLLRDIGNRQVAVVARWSFGKLLNSRYVTIAGDIGHQAYYFENWGEFPWFELPLGVVGQRSSSRFPVPGSDDRQVRIFFGGALTALQGIEELVRAFQVARTAQPSLHLTIAGEGPERQRIQTGAESLESVAFVGRLDQSDLKTMLERSDVLVAPYPVRYLPGPISSLKVLEFALTNKRIVVPSRDTLVTELHLGESDGVWTWDGDSLDELAATLVAAAEGAVSEEIPRRVARVLESRGPDRQASIARELLTSALGRSRPRGLPRKQSHSYTEGRVGRG